MLVTTELTTDRVLRGVDQQDFEQLQVVQGTFPYQAGLQKRLPGKSLLQEIGGPVGSIYVFYNVYGRNYTLEDFGTLQITEVGIPPFTLPIPPPVAYSWFDDFESYADDLVSKYWAGGEWLHYVGICEITYYGFIDPYIATNFGLNPSIELLPRVSPYSNSDVTRNAVPSNVNSQKGPSDCDDLPESSYGSTLVPAIDAPLQYTVIDPTLILTDGIRQDYALAVEYVDETGTWSAPAPFPIPPLVGTGGPGLGAGSDAYSGTYFTGFSWQRRRGANEVFQEASYDLELLDTVLPQFYELWLVGIKHESTSTKGVVLTECATLKISEQGQTAGQFVILSGIGATYHLYGTGIPNQESVIARFTDVTYTELRMYDFTPFRSAYLK